MGEASWLKNNLANESQAKQSGLEEIKQLQEIVDKRESSASPEIKNAAERASLLMKEFIYSLSASLETRGKDEDRKEIITQLSEMMIQLLTQAKNIHSDEQIKNLKSVLLGTKIVLNPFRGAKSGEAASTLLHVEGPISPEGQALVDNFLQLVEHRVDNKDLPRNP